MLHKWRSAFNAKNIRTRILARGISLTVLPLLFLVLLVFLSNSVANSVSVEGCFRLASKDLDHTVLGLLGACRLYHEDIADALDGARVVLNHTGAVSFDSSEQISWSAKNQVTSQVSQIKLPLMRVGTTPIRPVADFNHDAPVVDQVQALYKTTATIFQRMNEQGDMLRVATTVKNTSGARAIGTYIPAFDAEGKPNPVIATVLKGKPYLGRAFVVNAWYMAAYEPILDSHSNVVGVIYTGLPESKLRDKLLSFKDQWASAGTTDVFVIHTAAKARGLFVLSGDTHLQDHLAWDVRDAKGTLYVQQICKQALASGSNVSEAYYWSVPPTGGAPQKILARFVYFPAWDWVIGVQTPERSFQSTPTRIRNIFRISNAAALLAVLLATFICLKIWKKLTHELAQHMSHVMNSLHQSSNELKQTIQALSGHADESGAAAEMLFRSTELQARSAEETSATTNSAAKTASQNLMAAKRMHALSSETEAIVSGAKKTLTHVDEAMQAIAGANNQVLSIVDTINEISFATNIVALNASVEAAKAGESGRTFAFIADEVRSLSAKVAAAAQETRTTMNRTRKEMDRGTELVKKLVVDLSPIDQNAVMASKLAAEVSAASQGQAESMRLVLQAVEHISKSSETTALSAREGSRSASRLREEMITLKKSVHSVDHALDSLNEEFFSSAKDADAPRPHSQGTRWPV